MDSYDDLFEPFSPVNSPDRLFDLSDEELGSTKRVCLADMAVTVAHIHFSVYCSLQSTTTPGGYVIEEFSDDEIAFENDDFDDYVSEVSVVR